MIYNLIAMRALSAVGTLDGVTNKGPTCGIYTGSGGDIICVMAQDGTDTEVTFAATAPGTILPIGVKKIVSAPVDALALFL